MSNSNDWFQIYRAPIQTQHSNSKSSSTISKQIQRRSRASKKTPTTHLKANTSNFRELVQQFTGCPKKSLTLGSNFKGPINLDFKLGHVQNDTDLMNSHHDYEYDQQQECTEMDGFLEYVVSEGGGREQEERYGDLWNKQQYPVDDFVVAGGSDDANPFELEFIDLEADDLEMNPGASLVMTDQIQGGCFVNGPTMVTDDGFW